MKNTVVDQFLNDCEEELNQLEASMTLLGHTSPLGMFLTRYAIIKACGTIERAFKSLVADFAEDKQSQQVKNYLRSRIRESSMNPNENNITQLLKSFDESWAVEFSAKLKILPEQNRKKQSLKSLVEARNSFAHGGNPTTTITQVKVYFCDCRDIMNVIDESIA
jgi:hypothetical protein